jgi:hypothetical protein
LAGVLGCGGQTDAASDSPDAGGDAPISGVTDPSCVDGKQYTGLPSGACIEGASCNISTVLACPDGSIPTQVPKKWTCACVSEWSCTNTDPGGLSLPSCLGPGGSGGASGAGGSGIGGSTYTCAACASDYVTCVDPDTPASISVNVTMATEQGCHLEGNNAAWDIICDPLQVCISNGSACIDAQYVSGKLTFANTTCWQ